MHINNDNIVSDNLPIYFVWFGSDVPPKYFGNLLKAADTNKSRDIILVYSEKHLLPNNRKNIDRIENIKINEIKERVELKRDNETQNLWKIDVYDMELDKQIYPLLGKIFKVDTLKSTIGKFLAISDMIKLQIIDIVGGIYFDMDTEIIGEVGNLNTKYGFSFNVKIKDCIGCDKHEGKHINIASLSNFLAKCNEIRGDSNKKLFNLFMSEHVTWVSTTIDKYQDINNTAPVWFIDDFFIKRCKSKGIKEEKCYKMLSHFGNGLPSLNIILDNQRKNDRTINYNSQEDLKKLGLDKQDYGKKSSELENLSLEQPGNSQEKGR
ncbi:glycosyltransferase [Candidatus Mesenet endosymbiont of Agriotes lineatus]|uniref:glycosyltransferase n=1 Tax=Candidatus Mesenet endosymbiont of Agriotes lineatus TaxID=3077948 RepID=UPI0030CC40E0